MKRLRPRPPKHPASVPDFLATRDVPCPDCRYNLRGIREATCPECGKRLTLSALMRAKPGKFDNLYMLFDHNANHVAIVVAFLISLGFLAGMFSGHMHGWFPRFATAGFSYYGLGWFVTLLFWLLLAWWQEENGNWDTWISPRLYTLIKMLCWCMIIVYAWGVVDMWI